MTQAPLPAFHPGKLADTYDPQTASHEPRRTGPPLSSGGISAPPQPTPLRDRVASPLANKRYGPYTSPPDGPPLVRDLLANSAAMPEGIEPRRPIIRTSATSGRAYGPVIDEHAERIAALERVMIPPLLLPAPIPPAAEPLPPYRFDLGEFVGRLTSRVFLLTLAVLIQCTIAGVSGAWDAWNPIIKWEVAAVAAFGGTEAVRDAAESIARGGRG